MAASPLFEAACTALEAGSSLERIEARGTVRIALSKAGLDPKTVTLREMVVVLERVLPDELEARAVEDAAGVCRGIAKGLAEAEADDAARRPEDVFGALAR
jgi:hypothetical protein